MSLEESPPTRALDKDVAVDDGKHGRTGKTASITSELASLGKGEVFSLESVDPALNAKMHLVNNVRRPICIRGT